MIIVVVVVVIIILKYLFRHKTNLLELTVNTEQYTSNKFDFYKYKI